MKTVVQKTLILGIIGLFMTSCSCLKKSCEPDGLLSLEKAQEMEQNYIAYQYKYINEGLATEFPKTGNDDREIWFDIDEIEAYLCYAKKESLRKGHKLSGLRVYLAAKMEPNTITPDENDSIPRQTLFFVPTHKNPANRTVIRGSVGDGEGNEEGGENENTEGIKPLNYGSAGEPDTIRYGNGG